MRGLQPAEATILSHYRSEIAGGRILDLGVGAGRTAPFLLELSADYIGADYSPEMIKRCRSLFPGVEFAVVDARNLSRFSDSEFDLVLFSFNGIDQVGHADRLLILKEVHRVLKNGGLFVFSSHNRNTHLRRPWHLSHLTEADTPVQFVRKLVEFPGGIVNHLLRIRFQIKNDQYCILNDEAHMYSLMQYYISCSSQKAQLRHSGFEDIAALDRDGRWLSDEECDTCRDDWIHYVCRRSSPVPAT